jgi:hypothetical protein
MPTTGGTHHIMSVAGRIDRFRQRARNTPAALAILFDRAEKHHTAGGDGLLLYRSGTPPIAWLPTGAWHLPGTDIRGRGIVSLVMFALDIDAADSLVQVSAAIKVAASLGIDLALDQPEAAA